MNRFPIVLALALAAAPLMQGCVPLVAAGAGTAALVATDRRTAGIYLEDENIELKALERLHDLPGHVSATSFNRRVLLTGQVPDEAAKKSVQQAIRTIESVREVMDETQIAGDSSLASRGSDTLITSNVKARMIDAARFAPNHVKVVTEAGVVYLMGIVTHAEADAAVEIARTTSGVARVVTEFEYLA